MCDVECGHCGLWVWVSPSHQSVVMLLLWLDGGGSERTTGALHQLCGGAALGGVYVTFCRRVGLQRWGRRHDGELTRIAFF